MNDTSQSANVEVEAKNEATLDVVLDANFKHTLSAHALLRDNKTQYALRSEPANSAEPPVTIILTDEQAWKFAQLVIEMERLRP